MDKLEKFILAAKKRGYAQIHKGGKKIKSTCHDATHFIFEHGGYHYHDSYVGNTSFAGQETVSYRGKTVWSMLYYGYLMEPSLISLKELELFLKKALGSLYVKEKKFLGGYEYKRGHLLYIDVNKGNYQCFKGVEKIYKKETLVYELLYNGGTIR